ncbi:Flp pilus assembly pilin Flp [Catenuloplanes indicus]|uniref:Flp pilus assembly pilin Flp n=2 Tax=Catenuloplanes indicus TaxID=137267 RepID=A0AAE3W713_9ACTN|nr:Flp pilus assembly pilin Flp [Catenuloplanes indicus]
MMPLAGQAVLIVAVMVPPHPAGGPLGMLLAVFGVGLGPLSYALAIAVRTSEWMFWLVQQTLLFPLMVLSGMLLPLETGPARMRAAAAANPLAYLVDAERALFAGRIASTDTLWGVVAAGATAAIGLFAGIRAMLRSADQPIRNRPAVQDGRGRPDGEDGARTRHPDPEAGPMIPYVRTVIRERVKSDRGASAVEYGLLAALIAVVIIGAVTLVGSNLAGTFGRVAPAVSASP